MAGEQRKRGEDEGGENPSGHFRFHSTLSHTVARGRLTPGCPRGSQNITVRDWLFVAAPFEHHRNHRVHWTSHLTALRGEPGSCSNPRCTAAATTTTRKNGCCSPTPRCPTSQTPVPLFFSPSSTRHSSHLEQRTILFSALVGLKLTRADLSASSFRWVPSG